MAHKWRFFRAGGVDQVQLQTGADLAHLGELDQKLWVALACPVAGLELPVRTLQLIDHDHDNRVRAPELVAAARWVTSVLRDPELLVKGVPALKLDQIKVDSEQGKELLATARALLDSAGKPDAKELSADEVVSASAAFAKQAANGDGIVPPEAGGDDTSKAVLADIVAATPDAPVDRAGAKGVSTESAAAFFKDLEGYVAWLAAGDGAEARPLGDLSAQAFDALSAVKPKIEDYFARTRVATYDPRSLDALNPPKEQLASITAHPLSANADELSEFPLARIEAPVARGTARFDQGEALPLRGPVNPAWAKRLEVFADVTVAGCLGARDSLTAAELDAIVAKLSGHAAWRAQKPATPVAALTAERARALIDPAVRARVQTLIAADEAQKPKAAALESVERLVHLQRDLFELANNFVAFRAFYGRKGKAAFQYGTLFLDQRECELVLRVDDVAKHILLGPLSKCYLIYCEIRNAKGEKQQIVAVMSNGDSDNIVVGRNGLFYDRQGNDWDATVTKVVDNPISVRAAFWSPYKKVLRMLEEFVAKRAAAAEAESDQKLGGAVTTHTQAAVDGAPKPVKPPPKLDIGIVAALGVAVGGITAALGALLHSFFGLGIWMPLGILGLILAISGPSMAVAWLKLRQRNLGPLLDANGWAINARAKLNVPLGESLTRLATLPKGASRDFTDPFAEKRRPWGLYIFLFTLLGLGLLWYLGKLDRHLPESVQSTRILGDAAPSRSQPEVAPDSNK